MVRQATKDMSDAVETKKTVDREGPLVKIKGKKKKEEMKAKPSVTEAAVVKLGADTGDKMKTKKKKAEVPAEDTRDAPQGKMQKKGNKRELEINGGLVGQKLGSAGGIKERGIKKNKQKERAAEESVHLSMRSRRETPTAVEDNIVGEGSKKKNKKLSVGVGSTTGERTVEAGEVGEVKEKNEAEGKIFPGAEANRSKTSENEGSALTAKKKKKRVVVPVVAGADAGCTVGEKSPEEGSVSKKKKKDSSVDNMKRGVEVEGAISSIKRGGASKGASAGVTEFQEKAKSKVKQKNQAKRSSVSAGAGVGEEERTESTRERSKKRKVKAEGEAATTSDAVQEVEPKKKKKKQCGLAASEAQPEPERSTPLKRKRAWKRQNTAGIPLHKIKHEEDFTPAEESGQGVDVVFLSEKLGNKDEVYIDQERRRALQKEIDDASRPSSSLNLGQWGAAHFESDSQQQKFLRLMGGFKQGNKPMASSEGRASMTLGKEGQERLQQGLLAEFGRANSRQMDFQNRGAGLGFSAPSNKKFYIDIGARNSIRLDD